VEFLYTTLLSNGAEILGILGIGILAILILWFKIKITSFLRSTLLQDQVENDMSIRDDLASVRTKMSSDRSYVYMFHNGDHYTNGNSILKMSCTHESARPGVTKEGDHAQSILVSTVSEAVEGLVESFKNSDFITFTRIQDLQPCFYRSAMEAQGVTAVAKYPLYKDNNIIGFVGVDFMRSKVDTDKLHFLKECAPGLEYLVNKTNKRSLLSFFRR